MRKKRLPSWSWLTLYLELVCNHKLNQVVARDLSFDVFSLSSSEVRCLSQTLTSIEKVNPPCVFVYEGDDLANSLTLA